MLLLLCPRTVGQLEDLTVSQRGAFSFSLFAMLAVGLSYMALICGMFLLWSDVEPYSLPVTGHCRG